eukprot:SAG11_NODE_26189_length_348_cov_1.457831_1_plen_68_part_01
MLLYQQSYRYFLPGTVATYQNRKSSYGEGLMQNNFSKFLYARGDFPEYPYSIAQIQVYTVSLLRSCKT